jgi:hypothetical protein
VRKLHAEVHGNKDEIKRLEKEAVRLGMSSPAPSHKLEGNSKEFFEAFNKRFEEDAARIHAIMGEEPSEEPPSAAGPCSTQRSSAARAAHQHWAQYREDK